MFGSCSNLNLDKVTKVCSCLCTGEIAIERLIMLFDEDLRLKSFVGLSRQFKNPENMLDVDFGV
jgi:hypothetical protein